MALPQRGKHSGVDQPTALLRSGWLSGCHDYADYARCHLCCHPDSYRAPDVTPSWSVWTSPYIPHLSSKFLQLRADPPLPCHDWFKDDYWSPPNSSLVQASDLNPKHAMFYVLLGPETIFLDLEVHGEIYRQVVIQRLLHHLQEILIRAQLFITPLEFAIQCHSGTDGFTYRNYTPYHIFPSTVLAGFHCHKFLVPLKVTSFRPWFPALINEYRTFKRKLPPGATYTNPVLSYLATSGQTHIRGTRTEPRPPPTASTLFLTSDGLATKPRTPITRVSNPVTMGDFPEAPGKVRRKPVRPLPPLPRYPDPETVPDTTPEVWPNGPAAATAAPPGPPRPAPPAPVDTPLFPEDLPPTLVPMTAPPEALATPTIPEDLPPTLVPMAAVTEVFATIHLLPVITEASSGRQLSP